MMKEPMPMADEAPEAEAPEMPSLYLDGIPGAEELPESGTVTLRYKKMAQAEGPVCLEISEIVGSEGDAPEGEDREDALDKLAAEEKPAKSKFPDDEE